MPGSSVAPPRRSGETVIVPLSVEVPTTVTPLVAPEVTARSRIAPETRVRLPPNLPIPPTAAPDRTLTAVAPKAPFTSRVPLLTVVVPV